MSDPDGPDGAARKSYHHGNLREALVDAGRDLRLRSFHREDGVPEEQRLTPPQEDPGSDAPPEER